MKKYLPDLSSDMMTTILLRLPLFSVLFLKHLSKRWYNLIKDPKFQKLYNHTNTRTPLLYFPINSEIHSSLFPFYSTRPIPIPINKPLYHPLLLSNPTTSNNILCLIDLPYRNILIHDLFCTELVFHNLLTGESYLVSCPTNNYQPWLFYGFGYDSISCDYKFLCSCNNWCYVYNVRTRVWESFERIGVPFHFDVLSRKGPAYCFNGVLHSAQPRMVGAYDGINILTFDLHTYRFGLMELEWLDMNYHMDDYKVTELDGMLCFIQDWGLVMDLWVMREYGVGESWKKVFRIVKGVMTCSATSLSYSWMYVREDGRIGVLFVDHGGKVFWYDIHKETMENPVWQRKSATQNYCLVDSATQT